MKRAFVRMLADDSGVALVEYALVAAAFAVLMIGTLAAIAAETGTQLTEAGNGLTAFGASPP